MAKPNQSGLEHIYAMHRRWLSETLGEGDSLFTPGAAVWTSEHLDELEQEFTGRPDLAKNKRFLEKLHDQLANVTPEGVQLMSELHAIHFLIIWVGAISAAKKRSDLEAIVSWMPQPVAVPDDVLQAMSPGIVHPGQWVMTRRDTQLTWLIRFARQWRDLDGTERHRLTDDPWALKDFVESVQAPTSDSARLALLHLAHPDAFEAIVSPDHKQFIVARFGPTVDSSADVDRQLLLCREALTADYGEGFDWYADPLVHRWWKKRKRWEPLLRWLERFRALSTFEEDELDYKLDIAQALRKARELAEEDDSGWFDALTQAFKLSTNNLVPWQTYDHFLGWLDDDKKASRDALVALWSGTPDVENRIQTFLNLVPPTALGAAGARLNVVSFLLMATEPTEHPPLTISPLRKGWELGAWGREPDGTTPAQLYTRALAFLAELVRDSQERAHPLGNPLEAQGALWALTKTSAKPAEWSAEVWKEFLAYRASAGTDDEDEPPAETSAEDDGTVMPGIDFIATAATKLHVERAVLDEIVELLEDKSQVVLYGPPGTGKTYLAVELAKAIAEGSPQRVSIVQFHPATTYEDFFEGLRPRVTDTGQVYYKRTDGPLLDLVDKAAQDPESRPHILVIDEINRANLPKVFGELLFLLEYRHEKARTLYRPTEPFQLPTNLWILGTMNTADRSVSLIDAAMRRRFHFVPFFPHEGPMKGLLRRWLADGGGRLGVADFLDTVNAELLELLGEHLLIGPSHFMKTDLSDRALERIWTYNVFPLIEEQLWGNRDEIDRWRWSAVRERFEAQLTGVSVTAGDSDKEKSDEADESS